MPRTTVMTSEVSLSLYDSLSLSLCESICVSFLDEMVSCGDWLYSMGRTRSVKWIQSKNI